MPKSATQFNNQAENRVLENLKQYAQQEATLYIANPLASSNDPEILQFKRNYYSGIVSEISPTATGLEKLAMKFVKNQIKNLDAKLNPTWDNKLLYSKAGNAIRNFASGYNIVYKKINGALDHIQKDIIHKHNINTLSKDFAQKGFTINQESHLDSMIKLNLPEFHINYLDVNNKGTLYYLHCKRIPDTKLYFFEKITAKANPTTEELRTGNIGPEKKHTFLLNENPDINAANAARLVHGDDAKLGNSFAYLDTKPGGDTQVKTVEFNLVNELKKLNLPRLAGDTFAALKKALGEGKSYTLTLPLPGKGDTQCTIQATPRNEKHKISITDSNGNYINMNRFKEKVWEEAGDLISSITNNQQLSNGWEDMPEEAKKLKRTV
ncbi:hypothetical protein SAMN05421788_110169 [Filimonas lacunae]|uniref:Uncharacterized protein n=1 Tax=Filimonas lacunae TaxID=477680 RepID=A0A173MA51_9BACT|nr:hypothetical protein [Filimonas lacunae]BAV04434.1 hypothetical protein FLA_0425 [Filimonas lacunae]SIT31434.1 hypothetical protein SAMN05421788_110169 [Filimonas lacunae]